MYVQSCFVNLVEPFKVSAMKLRKISVCYNRDFINYFINNFCYEIAKFCGLVCLVCYCFVCLWFFAGWCWICEVLKGIICFAHRP